MFQTFSWYHVAYLGHAALWTLLLSAIALSGGAILGALLALMRIAPSRISRIFARVYIYIIQGTPLLVVLFLAYFGLAFLGFDIPPLLAAGVALTLYASAFLGEIWRGAVDSIDKGQWEGSYALGLSWRRTMRLVVIPQAVRVSIPPTVGFLVQLVKNTALASVIGFIELTRAGQIVSNATFQPLYVYLVVAAMYFVICYTLSLLSRYLEAKTGGNLNSIASQ